MPNLIIIKQFINMHANTHFCVFAIATMSQFQIGKKRESGIQKGQVRV